MRENCQSCTCACATQTPEVEQNKYAEPIAYTTHCSSAQSTHDRALPTSEQHHALGACASSFTRVATLLVALYHTTMLHTVRTNTACVCAADYCASDCSFPRASITRGLASAPRCASAVATLRAHGDWFGNMGACTHTHCMCVRSSK